MEFLTDFADQAVTLPVAAAVLLGLLATGWLRGALVWAGCVAGVLATMLALKLTGMACGGVLGWNRVSLVSPSGHTASACVVYGGLAALLSPRGRAGSMGVAVLACAVAAAVGATRLGLRVHSPAEVTVGALVGLAGVAVMRALAGPLPGRPGRPWLVLVAGLAILACHGHRLDAETNLRWLALRTWPLNLCATADQRLAPPHTVAAAAPLSVRGQGGL